MPKPFAISPARSPGPVAARRKPDAGPKELTAQHRRLIEAMVFGVDDERVREITRRVDTDIDGAKGFVDKRLEPGMPLRLDEAARVVGLRQKNARELFGLQVFQNALAAETQRLRNSAKPLSMAKLIELRDDPGGRTAADRKVQLAASQAILGDDAGSRPAPVTLNFGVTVTPGYVIDLSEPEDPAVAGRRTIDHLDHEGNT